MIWNIRHCKLKRQLCGHAGAVFAVDLDEKAKLAYTGSGDKVNNTTFSIVHVCSYNGQTIRQWEVHSGRCIRIIKASKTDSVLSIHLQEVGK